MRAASSSSRTDDWNAGRALHRAHRVVEELEVLVPAPLGRRRRGRRAQCRPWGRGAPTGRAGRPRRAGSRRSRGWRWRGCRRRATARSARQLPERRAGGGEPDRDADEQDAHGRVREHAEQRAGPAGRPVRARRTTRKPWKTSSARHDAEQEAAEVERQLLRALPAHRPRASAAPTSWPSRRWLGRDGEEPEHEPELAQREAVRLAAEVEVDRVGLGQEEQEREAPPRHGQRRARRRSGSSTRWKTQTAAPPTRRRERRYAQPSRGRAS